MNMIPHMIRQHAAEQPRHPAIVSEDGVLTYAALVERANSIAAAIRHHDAGRDSVVAIHLERSADLVAACFGVMIAGSAYLIIDTDQPTHRVATLLTGAGARAVVTAAARSNSVGCPEIRLADMASVGFPVAATSGSDLSPADLCYVNYTSGSSGTPKAVAIQHDGLSNLVAWYQAAYGIGPDDRMTQFARPSFDAFALEVWPCLASGATLYLCDSATAGSPRALQEWLLAHRITVCFLPTALAEEALQLPWPAQASLRVLLTGGDRLRSYPSANLPFRLFNNYGPTEVTVVSTWCEVRHESSPESDPPIGRPLPNLRAYVLDRNRIPVAKGQTGELYLAGVGVARGYLGQEEPTAERFHQDPSDTDGRMYSTGDLVRERPDGLLEFVGRLDEQFELHGIRVEPGEIESALCQHPGLRGAAVVLVSSAAGQRIGAFVVPGDRGVPQDLTEFATLRLPPYMLPSTYVPVSELPLTPQGKVDRRELERRLAATFTDRPAIAAMEAPRTDTERLLARLWRDVLNASEIGRRDSFFGLGGDSLLATRLARKAAEHGLRMSAPDVFDYELLCELAEKLERG